MFNKWIKNPAVALLACTLVLCTALAPRLGAQPYPINNPTYIPNPVLPSTAAIPPGQGSSYVFNVNGVGIVWLRVSGAPVGLVASVQGTEGRNPLTLSATVTMTSASPGVITWTGHGLSVNQPVVLSTTGALYTGLTAGTTYYVIAAGLAANTFEVAATPGGAAINTSGSQSGTQTATSTSVYWNNVGIQQYGGPGGTTVNVSSITGVGLYRVDATGLAAVRLNVSALTSGVTYVDFSGGASTGSVFSSVTNRQISTYSASALIGTGATTHFWTIAGSATKNVRILRAQCGGLATTAATVTVRGEVDSTADTGDAGTAATAVPHDSNDVAATAVVLSHTTSPTSGTVVGYPRSGGLTIGSATVSNSDLTWQFGDRFLAQEIVLRGVAQSFSLDTSAAFGAGASVGCSFEWTEE